MSAPTDHVAHPTWPEPHLRHSAVVVAVPEVEAAVAELRGRFDETHAWGVPAHVTVLHPWIPPQAIDTLALHRLRELVAGCEPFTAQLDEVAWFGDHVCYLRPAPHHSWQQLIETVCDAYPAYPAYGGAYDTNVPHLTVANGASRAAVEELLPAMTARLPITFAVTELTVLCGAPGAAGWGPTATIPLGRVL